MKAQNEGVEITQQWVYAAAEAAGLGFDGDALEAFRRVEEFNAAAPMRAQDMIRYWGTDAPNGGKGEVGRNGDLYLYGGTGQRGNRWQAGAGGWYPRLAVVEWPEGGSPRLVAVKMDWY